MITRKRDVGAARQDLPEEFVPIAEVVKAVGLSGEVKLYQLLDWYEPLLASEYLVWEDGQPVTVIQYRAQGGGTVVALAACADREHAEALCGRRLGFYRRRYLECGFPKPATGLPFRYLGREVLLPAGQRLGVVNEVRRYGNQITLVVLVAGREVLIPAVPPILRPDRELTGPLLIDPPEGLLDVGD